VWFRSILSCEYTRSSLQKTLMVCPDGTSSLW
jgi:hypothetical protein